MKKKRFLLSALLLLFIINASYSQDTRKSLVKIKNGKPLYYKTFNIDATKTISTNIVWNPYSLTSGITAGIFDAGGVLTNHNEFNNRVTQIDEYNSRKPYSTHVTVTMIASGNYMSVQGGINFSNFQNTESRGKSGYLLGVTRNIPLNDVFGINISALFSMQNILIKNLQTTATDGTTVYRMLYDYEIGILFIELPIQISYNIFKKKSFNLYVGVGSGLSIQFKDYSKATNFVDTGEIIDKDPPTDENPYIDDSPFEYSGININAGIWFTYDKLIFKILYINKMYEIKKINKTYTLSLNFGYVF